MEFKAIQNLAEAKLKKVMEELAEAGCMMSVALLTPGEQGFGFLYATNIPKADLKLRVLEQAIEDERESQGISRSRLILGNN